MPDKSLIMRKIAELELYMEQIGEFSGIGLEEYRREWRTQSIVERTLQIMIETCADIANHIIADSKMRLPTSYADTFRVLAENDMISAELLSVMEKMAKFRNIVVHQYDRVDAEIVMLILKKHLADFENFKNTILTLLKQKTP